MKRVLTALLVGLLAATWALAGPQEQTPAPSPGTESLGDVARKAKADRIQENKKPVKVFTNESVPREGGLSVIGPAGGGEIPDVTSSGGPEDQDLAQLRQQFRDQLRERNSTLDMHQRELVVLQAKLNLAEPQYYSDPNKALQQQTFRTDINELTRKIEEKKQQVAEDERAISDLRDEALRQGANESGLQSAAGAATENTTEPGAPETAHQKGAREYWQERFKAARERVARAQEEQQLAEDELSLLQTRQAQELSPASQSQLAQAIPAKQEEGQMKRAATEKASQDLDALQKEFEASGAPPDWSLPEPPSIPPM
jgi:chromosome segregation ATPase